MIELSFDFVCFFLHELFIGLWDCWVIMGHMNYVIGDIHGCGEELSRLLSLMSLEDGDRLWAVGDLFDRSVDAGRVAIMLQNGGIGCVRGNHEQKMLEYLRGERDYLPQHYVWAMNDLLYSGIGPGDLEGYLESLPLLRDFGDWVLVHAGVDIDDVRRESLDRNVFCKEKWWENYSGDVKVVYGHTACGDHPRVVGNSIGLDTSCCHGGYLTSYCVETGEVYRVKALRDWYGYLREKLKKSPIQLDSVYARHVSRVVVGV